jgi:Protein of unknown function (DUF3223)
MPYQIGGVEFNIKSEITDRCRLILNSIPDGGSPSDEQCEFLFDLFRYHDEWVEKSTRGIKAISTQTTEHGTRCFVLIRKDESKIDISFPHSIKLIPTKRTQNLVNQRLLDYKAAARTAIKGQIQAFRNEVLRNGVVCPYTGDLLKRDNCAIDHTPPDTFDKLLFQFSLSKKINPTSVGVGSINGVVAEFVDKEIETNWQLYHQQNAKLRVISRIGNLQFPKESVSWNELI